MLDTLLFIAASTIWAVILQGTLVHEGIINILVPRTIRDWFAKLELIYTFKESSCIWHTNLTIQLVYDWVQLVT